ncbi:MULTISPECIES: Ig-like domain-containing protein [Bifidobacterium]|nr:MULTISPECIES: Ig-like domain-containing protein [Bifidobacterium]
MGGWKKKMVGVLAAVATVATMGLTAVTANAADEVGTDAAAKGNVYQALEYLQDLNTLRASTNRRPLTLQQIADAKNTDNNTTVYTASNVASNPADGSAVPALKVNSDMMTWAQARANELAKQGSISHDDMYNGKPDWYKCNNSSFAQCTGGLNLAESSEFKGGYVFGPEALAIGYPDMAGYENSHNPVNSWYSELDYEIKNPNASASDLRKWRQGYGHYLTEVSPLADIAGFGVAKVTSGQWKGATISVLEIGNSKTAEGKTQSVEDALKEYAPKKTITSVDNPAAIDVDSSTTKPTAQLPAKVTAHYSDNTSGNVDVTWDVIPDSWNADRDAHTVTVEGTVDGYEKKVTATLNVADATITSATLDNGKTELDVTTPSGTDPAKQLPAKGKIVWSNGDETTPAITWTTSEQYKDRNGGTYDLTGTIAGTTATVTAHVTVKAATIESVENPADRSTTEGVVPALPESAKVTWSNGDSSNELVVWNEPENFKDLFNKAGETVTMNGEIKGHSDKKVRVKIAVTAATIESVTAPKDVTINAGDKLGLHDTVTAKLSNGNDSQVSVQWKTDGVDFSNRTGKDKTVTVKGEIAGYTPGVDVKVTIRSAKATSATVKGDTTITVDSGKKPELPKEATVTWNDGGKDSAETITWDAFDKWQNRDGGEFTVNGKAAGQAVSVTVKVNAATVKLVENGVDIPTTVGKAPQLPKTVKVHWSNGDVTDEPAVWNTVPADSYAKAGSFSVEGKTTVKGADYALKANVTVREASNGGNENKPTPNPGASTKPGSTTTTSPNPTPSPNKTQVATNTATNASKQGSQLSRTGAAIGGIVAVVVILAAIAGLVFYMKSKRTH